MSQLEQDTSTATQTCDSEVSMDCGSGGGGSNSGSGNGSNNGSNGLGSGCQAAIDDCVMQTQSLLQNVSLPDCGSSLVTACSNPNNAAKIQGTVYTNETCGV